MILRLEKNTTRCEEQLFSQKETLKIRSFSKSLIGLTLCLGKSNGKTYKTPIQIKKLPQIKNIGDYNSIWFEYKLINADESVDFELN